MDPSELDSGGGEQGAGAPTPAEGATPAEPPAGPAGGASPLARVLTGTPDLILMLQVDDEQRLGCRSALSSRPEAPGLADLIGKGAHEIFPPDVLERLGARLEEARASHGPVEYEESLDAGEGPLHLAVTLTPIFSADGGSRHLFWAARDVTDLRTLAEESERLLEEHKRVLEDHRRLEQERDALLEERERASEEGRSVAEALRESEERFAILFERASIGIAWTDLRGAFLEVNPALSQMLGRDADHLLQSSIGELAYPDDADALQRLISDVASGDPEAVRREGRLLHERGHAVWVQADVLLLRDREGAPHRLLWQVQDMTERRGLEDRLAHQALHDSLTGLPNRAVLLDRLGQALARLERNPVPLAVVLADVDGLDSVNDEHGHEVGDRLLVGLADSLRERIRQADTIARLGGDEFVLLFEAPGDEDTSALAKRVTEAMGHPVDIDGTEVRVTASAGVAVAESPGERPETLLRNAALALQKAKAKGTGRVALFDDSMRAETAQRLKTEEDLREAIEEGQFVLFYQPQVNLETGTIVGAEVLSRWQHPERGLVTPSGFLDLAEESGLIVPLGAWVVEEACRQSEVWRDLRPGEPFLTMVNLSPRELLEPDYPEMVSKVLADTGAEASSLCLEIGESVLMEESSTSDAVAALRALKDLGVTICIRDFGTGFSSHAYLKRLPVDMLKLDQAFVSGLGRNEEDAAIVAAVINLARAMGLRSIAQGVETAEQLAALRELGCDLAVGYFFASPQPAEVMSELLRQDLRW